jgi:transposase-like protein
MAKQSTLSAGERSQLVLRLLSKEEPAAQIARRAGVSEQSLYRWRDEFLSAGKQALAGRGADREQAKELRQLKSLLAERDQVIGELTIANRILKKLSGGSS